MSATVIHIDDWRPSDDGHRTFEQGVGAPRRIDWLSATVWTVFLLASVASWILLIFIVRMAIA